MKDELSIRMKENYEKRTRLFLPRRTNTIIRIDGKAFHTFTRGFKKPFDYRLSDAMNLTAKALCENIQGSVVAYVQSDEISILLNDSKKLTSDAWFDGNTQKITSVSASIATAYFNKYINEFIDDQELMAMFDSRVFTIPEENEVINYFRWRQQDAVRNSIQMLARSLYSHKECNNKNGSELQEMCFQKGRNWNDVDTGWKRGRMIVKTEIMKELKEDVGKKLHEKGDERLMVKDGKYYIPTTGWTISPAVDIGKDVEHFRKIITETPF